MKMVPEANGHRRNGVFWRELACFVGYLPFFTQAIQECTINKYPFFRRADQIAETNVPWSTTAALSASIISGPLLCIIADRFGRVCAIFAIGIVQIMTTVSCIITVGSHQIYLLPNILLGISAGGVYSVLPMYVKEVSEPKTSGFSTMMMTMTSLGQLIMLLKMNGKTMMILQAGLVVIQLLVMFCLLETPSYLVMKDSEQKAGRALARLQRSTNAKRVADDIAALRREADNARAAGGRGVAGIFKNSTWRNATKLGVGLHTAYVLGGSDLTVRGGEVVRHGAAGGGEWALLVPAAMTAGALVAVAAVGLFEMKYILTSSFTISALSLGILGVFMQTEGGTPDHPWLALTAATANVFGYALGWGLPYVLMTQVLNLEIRATLIGFLTVYTQGLRLVQVHSSEWLKGFVGVYTLCYMFAGINLFGGLYSLFGLPDVRNKSVARIEKQLMYIPPWKF